MSRSTDVPADDLPSGRCPRALAAWTGGCARRRWTVLLLAALLTVLAGLAIATRLGVSTNTVDMLSPDLPFRQHAKELNRAFPQLDDTIVAVVDAPTPERADALADALERRLAAVDTLAGVYRPDGAFVRRHALYYLSPDRLAALLDRLAAAQPLLATLAERPDLRGLSEVLALAADAGADVPAEGLAPLLAEMAASAEALADGQPRNLSWQALLPLRPDGAPATRRFLILTPKLDYSLLKPAKAAIADVRAASGAVAADASTDDALPADYERDVVDPDGALSDAAIDRAIETAWANEDVRAALSDDATPSFEVWAEDGDGAVDASVWVSPVDGSPEDTVVADVDLDAGTVTAVSAPEVVTADEFETESLEIQTTATETDGTVTVAFSEGSVVESLSATVQGLTG